MMAYFKGKSKNKEILILSRGNEYGNFQGMFLSTSGSGFPASCVTGEQELLEELLGSPGAVWPGKAMQP